MTGGRKLRIPAADLARRLREEPAAYAGAFAGTLVAPHIEPFRGRMTFGAYFIPEEEWEDAQACGLDWCAWPPVVPDSKGTGEGFVTERVVVDLRTKERTLYTRDEVQHPGELDPEHPSEFAGSFVTLGKRELGLNAHQLSSVYQRAIVNYFLCKEPHWLTVESGVLAAHRCAAAWAGTGWTAVVNANWGGLMDRASETETVPTYLLIEQVDWYRELGASRLLWWRWDSPCGRAGIDAVMTRVQRLRGLGDL